MHTLLGEGVEWREVAADMVFDSEGGRRGDVRVVDMLWELH